MCADNYPSPVASDVDYSPSESSHDNDNPAYTPQALASIFLDFYLFLATLHYDLADLKIAPSDGWPGITREALPGWKSDYAIEVMRRLPYYRSKAALHFKCRIIDYTSFTAAELLELDYVYDEKEIWDDEGPVDHANIICICYGWETCGRMLFLDVQSGMITEEMVRANILSPEDVKTYFDGLKDAYRTLNLIPCEGRFTIEADLVPERDPSLGLITEDQVCAQEEEWGTDLDIQYLRQLYRHYGWPSAFRAHDAKRVVDDMMNRMEEKRLYWLEESPIIMWNEQLS